ncbi:cupin domain-containing protein [Patescibacteria group bacterium]
MITIFANIKIDDANRLQHLKDSFLSFDTISDNWLINIRGDLRNEAIRFLQEHLGDKMVLFELLDDSKGWVNNSLEMIDEAKYDYLLFWVEDHLNIASQDVYAKIVEEMKVQRADYLLYSWWRSGRARKAFESVELTKGRYIDSIYLTKKEWKKVINAGHTYYLITLCGIFHKDFFKKLLIKDRIKFPTFIKKNVYRMVVLVNRMGFKFDRRKCMHIIDKLSLYKLTTLPKETPFNLEKVSDRYDMLPIKLAISKQELFACIDDDAKVLGDSLIKRGLYPTNIKLQTNSNEAEIRPWGNEELIEKNNEYTVYKIALQKGKEYSQRYYEDEFRTHLLLRKTIILMSGSVEVISGDSSVLLLPGKIVSLHPNIKHTIKAKEDSVILIVFSSLHNKKIKHINND